MQIKRDNGFNMKKRIDLTEEKLKELKGDDLVAITMVLDDTAEDPKAVELVDKDLKIYYTHLGDFDDEKLERLSPLFGKVIEICGAIDGTRDDWVSVRRIEIGYYLFVRPKYKNPIERYIDEHYSGTETEKSTKLWLHWYEALKDIMGKNEYLS